MMDMVRSVEQWGVFELEVKGKTDGNPFTDYHINGRFWNEFESVGTKGFYDGDGVYRIRFMPSFEGEYQYCVKCDFLDEVLEGCFMVDAPGENNRGPVKVADQYHFTYSDGSPYYQIGTTCYAWVHQPLSVQEQTLKTLAESPFNKIRFCVFPKHYDYNLYEPLFYPYEGTPCGIEGINKSNFGEFLPSNPENQWDFTRFGLEHFRLFEKRIADLQKLGIEADIILFHPYDRWGFSQMTRSEDECYLDYVIARFSAYRNVWWSMANEYDLMPEKSAEDWEYLGRFVHRNDPYHRLLSIHNCKKIYDFTRPWISHCSIQRTEPYIAALNTKLWRQQYGKPVVLDEVGYEGNINFCWGNLTAEEMVRQFWLAAVRGGYCSHGETYLDLNDQLWWSYGGILKGESAPRLKFLHDIFVDVPGLGLEPVEMKKCDDDCATASHIKYRGKFFLYYAGSSRPGFKQFYMPEGKRYQVDLIDTWNMTIEDMKVQKGTFSIPMPSRQYMAVRMKEV